MHITNIGQMMFLLSTLNMTQEFSYYGICVVQMHDMHNVGSYTANLILTATLVSILICFYMHI